MRLRSQVYSSCRVRHNAPSASALSPRASAQRRPAGVRSESVPKALKTRGGGEGGGEAGERGWGGGGVGGRGGGRAAPGEVEGKRVREVPWGRRHDLHQAERGGGAHRPAVEGALLARHRQHERVLDAAAR